MKKYSILTFVLFTLMLLSCKKESTENPNPYNTPDKDIYLGVGGNEKTPDPNSIQGLHKNIFKPTCANSGCHDGNFEPDFRSIESSYYTLVNQPVIKNDILNPFSARVTPGKAETSMIIKRLTEDLNGNSGIMPLVIEPGSDWTSKKETYIQNIKNWINDGAKDMSGNPIKPLDFPPQLQGFIASKGPSFYPRTYFYSPVEIPAGAGSVDLWFAFTDDICPIQNLGTLKINFSKEVNIFNPADEQALSYTSAGKNEKGIYKTNVDFNHKITVNPASLGNPGDIIWVRTRVDDGVNPTTEIPSDNSFYNAKKYFAIKLI